MSENKLNDPKKFILAGKSIFTVRNENTQNRFTYRVRKCKDKDIWFVGILTGSDNNNHYSYLGTIFSKDFRITKRSKFNNEDVQVKAFDWTWRNLNNLPEFVSIFHEGRCGRCGRRLTVPESIESGFGPECINRI